VREKMKAHIPTMAATTTMAATRPSFIAGSPIGVDRPTPVGRE
jgi:hypothetical protein